MSLKHKIQLLLVALLCRDSALAWATIGNHKRANAIMDQRERAGLRARRVVPRARTVNVLVFKPKGEN